MSKRVKAPVLPPAIEAAALANAEAANSVARSFPSKSARAAELLSPLTKDAAEMNSLRKRSIEAANFGTAAERAHRKKFDGYLQGELNKATQKIRKALTFFNDSAERYGVKPVSPTLSKALEDCAQEIRERIAHAKEVEKAERVQMAKAIPRLSARYKAGARPHPYKELTAEAVALLRANKFSAADAKRLAGEHMESVGLRAPPASKQKNR